MFERASFRDNSLAANPCNHLVTIHLLVEATLLEGNVVSNVISNIAGNFEHKVAGDVATGES